MVNYPFNEGDIFLYHYSYGSPDYYIVQDGECKAYDMCNKVVYGTSWEMPKRQQHKISNYKHANMIYLGGE